MSGAKAVNLRHLSLHGFSVPATLLVPPAAYVEFVGHTGLSQHIEAVAAGIVEHRGGMLVHGAIIAREYGIPCVTGVDEATVRVKNGQMLLVDGFRGEITLEQQG